MVCTVCENCLMLTGALFSARLNTRTYKTSYKSKFTSVDFCHLSSCKKKTHTWLPIRRVHLQRTCFNLCEQSGPHSARVRHRVIVIAEVWRTLFPSSVGPVRHDAVCVKLYTALNLLCLINMTSPLMLTMLLSLCSTCTWIFQVLGEKIAWRCHEYYNMYPSSKMKS